MRRALLVSLLLASACGPAHAPATGSAAPTSQASDAMGISSTKTERGQRDAVGFATSAAQMAEVWSELGVTA
jgi:hypothetical protein